MKLSDGQRHLLKLARKDANDEGWAKVSLQVWPKVLGVPDDLLEKERSDDGGGRVRLTHAAEAFLKYT